MIQLKTYGAESFLRS